MGRLDADHGLGHTRQRCREGRVVGGAIDLLLVEHPLQDERAARLRPLGVAERREAPGRGDESREHRGLGEVELRDGLAEVEPRRLLDSGDRHGAALPEVDLVEVGLEDLLLAVLRVEDDGEERLDGLPPKGPLGGQEEVLDELLGQRARSPHRSAAHQALEDGSDEPLRGEARVREEVPVLRRQDRVDDDLRHLGEADERPVLHLLVEDGTDDFRLEDDVRERGSVGLALEAGDPPPREVDPRDDPGKAAVGRLVRVDADDDPAPGEEIPSRR